MAGSVLSPLSAAAGRGAAAFAAAVVCVAASCSPLIVDENRELLELERFWQFLKVYSIWQSAIPPDPFAPQFASPNDLAHPLHDTINDAESYTSYWPPGAAPWWAQDMFSSSASAQDVDTFVSVIYTKPVAGISRIRILGFEKRFEKRVAVGDSIRLSLQLSTCEELAAIADSAGDLIIDLRGNGGGYIDVLDTCVELFLTAGTPYIDQSHRVYDASSRTASTVHEVVSAKRTGDRWEGRRIAILVNYRTASAAEIFAAGLQDGLGADRVRIIGTTTYGKAIGQHYLRLYNGATLSVTAYRFRRVVGDSSFADYFRRGIVPDVQESDSLAMEIAAVAFLRGNLTKESLPPPVNLASPRGMRSPDERGCFSVLRQSDLPLELLTW